MHHIRLIQDHLIALFIRPVACGGPGGRAPCVLPGPSAFLYQIAFVHAWPPPPPPPWIGRAPAAKLSRYGVVVHSVSYFRSSHGISWRAFSVCRLRLWNSLISDTR